ncbi:unnamed protein product [Nyctereutes procyonoides]|uniref:(raccoon dog) hypothetical protein n=1 Tax=Nyctereutes procyonoides TaxID=34880 RepID=A0A811ZH28_NYCPR|nr:unnamed protein product [Nyctereutes procyonoides]
MPRVYTGRLSCNVREKDIQRCGRLLETDLRNGHGFVELEESRDADAAVEGLKGKELGGERARGRRFGRRRTSGRDKFGPPVPQNSGDFMRQAGEGTHADAHEAPALDKLDGTEINGRNIRLIEDKPRTSHGRSYSGSRSRVKRKREEIENSDRPISRGLGGKKRERQRGAVTQEEGEAGSMPGARCGTRSRDSSIAPWAKGRRQTAEPPRDPLMKTFKRG